MTHLNMTNGRRYFISSKKDSDSSVSYYIVDTEFGKITYIGIELRNQGGKEWEPKDGSDRFVKVMNDIIELNKEDTIAMLSELLEGE